MGKDVVPEVVHSHLREIGCQNALAITADQSEEDDPKEDKRQPDKLMSGFCPHCQTVFAGHLVQKIARDSQFGVADPEPSVQAAFASMGCADLAHIAVQHLDVLGFVFQDVNGLGAQVALLAQPVQIEFVDAVAIFGSQDQKSPVAALETLELETFVLRVEIFQNTSVFKNGNGAVGHDMIVDSGTLDEGKHHFRAGHEH